MTKECFYVSNSTGGDGNGSITVYTLNSSGNIAPVSTITGPSTGLDDPQAIALDKNRDIYVSNYATSPSIYSSITVYAAGASGDAEPIRTITGPDTGLGQNYGINIDQKGQIVVSETLTTSRIAFFAPGADSTATPLKWFGLKKHPLDTIFWAVTSDNSGKTYVTGVASPCRCGRGRDELLVYAKGAKDYQPPMQQISGRKSTITFPKGVTVDKAGNMYVANSPNPGQVGDLLVFDPSANKNARPMRSIAGRYTLFEQPDGVALDSRQRLYVSDGADRILTFAAGADGDVSPTHDLRGDSTGLSGVTGIAVR
jgi:hypothetical protein